MKLDLLLTKVPQRITSQRSAWLGGKYETFRLNFEIPAARMHQHGTSPLGSWYAVDEYNLSVAEYHNRYALLAKQRRPQLELVVLVPGTTVNVGKANRQGAAAGGGLQFEVLPGSPQPRFTEHADNPRRVRY